MSYCRFGEADVYVFVNAGGWLECCGCVNDENWHYYSTDDMIAHLKEHKSTGDNVPDYVFTDLLKDKEENDAYIEDNRIGDRDAA